MDMTKHEQILLAQCLIDEVTGTLQVLRGKLAIDNPNMTPVREAVLLTRSQFARIEAVVSEIGAP
jgi:hypothetical protein